MERPSHSGSVNFRGRGEPERLERPDRLAEQVDAEERAGDEQDPVDLEGRGGDERGAGAEPADDEADAHDEAADDPGPEVGRVHPHAAHVEQAERGGR